MNQIFIDSDVYIGLRVFTAKKMIYFSVSWLLKGPYGQIKSAWKGNHWIGLDEYDAICVLEFLFSLYLSSTKFENLALKGTVAWDGF